MFIPNATGDHSQESCERVYCLLDFSPSMDVTDYQPSRRQGAIEATKEFIKVKQQNYPQDQVGLIGFDSKAHVLHNHIPVGSSVRSLFQSLRPIKESCGTNFVDALELAEKCISKHDCKTVQNNLKQFFKDLMFEPEPKKASKVEPTSKRIILLTDGEHIAFGNPVTVANRLKMKGVVIECIGIAGSPREVDETMLKAIASKDSDGNARYWFIKDTQQLIRKYQSMASHIKVV